MSVWCDPSTGLSASAASGLMLAGEGNEGADKVWAPAESIEPTALHLSLKDGRRGWCMGQKEQLWYESRE